VWEQQAEENISAYGFLGGGGVWTCCSRNTIRGNRVIDDGMSCVCRMLRGDEKLLKYSGRNSSERRYHLVQLNIAGRATVKLTLNVEG
jgi:hypothetical protein